MCRSRWEAPLTPAGAGTVAAAAPARGGPQTLPRLMARAAATAAWEGPVPATQLLTARTAPIPLRQIWAAAVALERTADRVRPAVALSKSQPAEILMLMVPSWRTAL